MRATKHPTSACAGENAWLPRFWVSVICILAAPFPCASGEPAAAQVEVPAEWVRAEEEMAARDALVRKSFIECLKLQQEVDRLLAVYRKSLSADEVAAEDVRIRTLSAPAFGKELSVKQYLDARETLCRELHRGRDELLDRRDRIEALFYRDAFPVGVRANDAAAPALSVDENEKLQEMAPKEKSMGGRNQAH